MLLIFGKYLDPKYTASVTTSHSWCRDILMGRSISTIEIQESLSNASTRKLVKFMLWSVWTSPTSSSL